MSVLIYVFVMFIWHLLDICVIYLHIAYPPLMSGSMWFVLHQEFISNIYAWNDPVVSARQLATFSSKHGRTLLHSTMKHGIGETMWADQRQPKSAFVLTHCIGTDDEIEAEWDKYTGRDTLVAVAPTEHMLLLGYTYASRSIQKWPVGVHA